MSQKSKIWDGKVEFGRIVLEDRDGFHRLLESMEGQEIEMTLQKFRRKRSLSQNAWYWGCIVPLLGEHIGYDPEEMHEALKERFLRDRENERDGLVRIKSSAALNTAEFSAYCEQCVRLAAEMGVIIPLPGEL